jgi:hypothetical protein
MTDLEIVELALRRAARNLRGAENPVQSCIAAAIEDIASELRNLRDAPRDREPGQTPSRQEIADEIELQAELERLRP